MPRMAALVVILAASLSAQTPTPAIDVYVTAAAGGTNGFTDPGFKDRQDSAADVRKDFERMAKKSGLRVVTEPTRGAVHIEIVERARLASGSQSSLSTRATASVMATSTTEEKVPTVIATLKVDGYETRIEGQGVAYWTQASYELADKIAAWIGENRARLASAKTGGQ